LELFITNIKSTENPVLRNKALQRHLTLRGSNEVA
jgi:hypothetical protein